MKYPPYGKRLADVIRQPETWPQYSGTSANGRHLTLWIAIGNDAWQWARDRIGRLLIAVIPDGESPEEFNLAFIKGHDPILVQVCGITTAEFIQSTVTALIRDGAQRVLVLQQNGSTLYKETTI